MFLLASASICKFKFLFDSKQEFLQLVYIHCIILLFKNSYEHKNGAYLGSPNYHIRLQFTEVKFCSAN